MKLHLTLIAFVCLIALSLSVSAQPSASSTKIQEEQKKQKELELKALVMLDELIEESRSLRLPENRMRVLVSAADLLWQHDEKRARGLFSELTKTLAQLIQQPEDSPDVLPENLRHMFFSWRQEVVQLIARNDAQLALDFLSATRLPNSTANNDEHESQLELSLAQQIIQQDPKRALAIAKEKLAKSKNPGSVGHLLYMLRDKDISLAQELVDSILSKLRAEDQLGFESASYAISLLEMAPQPNDAHFASTDHPKPLISAAVARELIEKVLAAAQVELAKTRGQIESSERYNAINLINSLKSSTPYIEKYAPASLPGLKRILPEAEKMKDPSQRRWDEFNELAAKGSPDLLLQAAAKAPAEMRYSYFQRAAQLAKDKGDVERARQIIKENVSDTNQQRQALREIDQQLMWQRINEGRFEDARQLVDGIRYEWERANILAQIAMSAYNNGKKEMANQFLEEALALAGTQIESSQAFSNQLQLIGTCALINPARGFEFLEATLDQFNELLAAASVVESFQQQGSFRQKEMVLTAGGSASQYLPQYGQHLASLARIDLLRAQATINRFVRPEARIAVQMFVLQQLLPRRNGVVAEGSTLVRGNRLHLIEIH